MKMFEPIFFSFKFTKVLNTLKVGSLTLLGGFISLLLPETLDQPLPQKISEIEEAENSNQLKNSSL